MKQIKKQSSLLEWIHNNKVRFDSSLLVCEWVKVNGRKLKSQANTENQSRNQLEQVSLSLKIYELIF